LQNIVEIDETYVGGKCENQHKSKKNVNNKTVVFGAVERTGNVVTKVLPDIKADNLIGAVKQIVEENAIMVSDELQAYGKLNKNYKHVKVNHSRGEYVRDLAHTNTIEGFWSQLKRQIVGIHHYVSPKHLQRYCNEAAFRYNAKTVPQDERFASVLLNIEGSLKYSELTANPMQF
jgi:transposase-like protein